MLRQVKVLVVDDSAFFRHRITEVLQQSPTLQIVGTAVDGRDAVEKTLQLKPDVITMDVEMPVMDGIEAVRNIMARQPTPILMFSNLTSEGAKVTLDALDAGAVDFLSKNFTPSSTYDDAYIVLREKVTNIALRTNTRSLSSTVASRVATPAATVPSQKPQQAPEAASKARSSGRYELLAIGASTGGPVAVQTVLTGLPASFPLPVVVMVHMPAAFTNAYANRLNDLCQVTVREACDGDALMPGQVLIAPGGKQMLIEKRGGRSYVEIKESLPGQTYKPSVDVGFGSAAQSFGSKVLAVVLTGMGSDGKMGAQKLKQAGATVWSQDQDSCVVYGMPQAVEKAGLSDAVFPIGKFSAELSRVV
jgi:two-component system chemotaxis response regulator CheB